MKRAIFWAPLALFLLFVAVVVGGLGRPDDRIITSRLVGAQLPEFALPPAAPGKPPLRSSDLADGRPHLLNVFASWCVPCIAEAPQLVALARAGVPIEAIAIRDRPQDVADFLKRHGDPYQRIGADAESRVQLALGSSGVPESFVVDGKGVIVRQHIGEIRPEDVPVILASLRAAR